MTALTSRVANSPKRRTFIGGSDARVVIGGDQAALHRLWREKRGEPSRKTCPAIILQLGLATEPLNRQW